MNMKNTIFAKHRLHFAIGMSLASSFLLLVVSKTSSWVSSYTPDSEFYYSLSIFTHEVTDRAPTPAYYFTKIGIIGPQHILIHFFGISTGFLIYKAMMIFLISFSTFIVLTYVFQVSELHNLTLATMILTNTTILSFIGDAYATGSLIACLFIQLAISGLILVSENQKETLLFGTLGLAFAWEIMINPTILFMSILAIYLPLFVVLFKQKKYSILNLLRFNLFWILGFTIGSIGFLKLGKLLFPKLDLVQSVIFWMRILKPSSYSSNTYEWIKTEIIFIPIFVTLFIAWMAYRKSKNFVQFFYLTSLTIAIFYFLSNSILLKSAILEANFYNALLWPFTLIVSLISCLILLENFKKVQVHRTQQAFFEISFSIGILTSSLILGFSNFRISMGLAIIMGLIICFLYFYTFRILLVQRTGTQSNQFIKAIFVLVTILFIVSDFQVMQNGLTSGKSAISRVPYVNAFKGSTVAYQYQQNIVIEKWVLENTMSSDKLMVWTNPSENVVSAAAMQLFGPNSIQASKSVQDWQLINLKIIKPNVIVFYGYDDRLAKELFFSFKSLNFRFEISKCSKFNYSRKGIINVCIAHLQW